MTEVLELRGAIIAAGEGSRLSPAGFGVPKPMVPIAGVPLIEWVIRNFIAARITSLVIVFNEQERACLDFVRARFPDLELRFIVKNTASSFESFREAVASPGGGPMLVSTVDAWCPEADFVRFVQHAVRRPAPSTVLAVTPLVADEKPLWVRLDATGRITALGGDSGEVVTAGVYLVSEDTRKRASEARFPRLRDFLAGLVLRGERLHAEIIPQVIDVDRVEDVVQAEALAVTISAKPSMGENRI